MELSQTQRKEECHSFCPTLDLKEGKRTYFFLSVSVATALFKFSACLDNADGETSLFVFFNSRELGDICFLIFKRKIETG